MILFLHVLNVLNQLAETYIISESLQYFLCTFTSIEFRMKVFSTYTRVIFVKEFSYIYFLKENSLSNLGNLQKVHLENATKENESVKLSL